MEEVTLRALRQYTGKLRLLEDVIVNIIETGSIVKALRGRDSERLFVVVDTAGDYAHISDGLTRPLAKAKLKKHKHLQYLGNCNGSKVYDKLMTGKPVQDAEIRKVINLFSSEEDK